MSKRPVSAATVQAKRQKTLDGSEMTTTTAGCKRILVLGLSGHAPARAASSSMNSSKGRFRYRLKETAARAKESGLELDIVQAKPSDFSSALRMIKEKLRSRPDGFVIGNGIRGASEHTVFFEDLVNASREITPETRLAFNTSPDDILECCLRNFA